MIYKIDNNEMKWTSLGVLIFREKLVEKFMLAVPTVCVEFPVH